MPLRFSQQPRNYESGYRRNPTIKYKRNNDRPPAAKHFQGTYPGPTKTFMKNSQKYIQSGNNSYDSTPMKDNGTKPHQHGHGLSKREQSNTDVDNQNGNNGFGSNVPPFPYFEPGEQQHYGPPGNGKTVAKTLNFFKENTRFRSCFSLMINIFFRSVYKNDTTRYIVCSKCLVSS